MAAIIRTEQIRDVLRVWVGSALADASPMAEQAATVMSAFIPRRTQLADVASQLEDIIFRGLYAALGRNMTTRLDDGRLRRIRMDDLPDLADDVLGVLLEALDVYAVSYTLLREYAMTTGSFSAFRVLYTRYASFQTPEEMALLARVLRERYPAGQCPEWLQMPG